MLAVDYDVNSDKCGAECRPSSKKKRKKAPVTSAKNTLLFKRATQTAPSALVDVTTPIVEALFTEDRKLEQ